MMLNKMNVSKEKKLILHNHKLPGKYRRASYVRSELFSFT